MVAWIDHQYENPPFASDAVVAAIEAELGVRLPADYLAVARERQGGTPEPGVLRMSDGGTCVFNSLLALDPALDGQMNVVSVTKDWLEAGLIAPGVVLFADTPGGDFLAFDFSASATEPPVAHVSHEDDGPSALRIADSFSALLGMLHD